MTWSPETDARLLHLRDEQRLRFSTIAPLLHKSRSAVVGRYYRITGHGFPSDRRHRPRKQASGPKLAHHEMRGVPAAKYPYAPDCSCPDFAWDDDHCGAVMAAGGFPILERRAA